jgi:bifunctional UDP-N-acetylglucosamine pyrophosphorylase/glucosamine-1-phosphate N-acetyltransferase
MSQDVLAIVLAAGQGSRMKSNTPKVLHKLAGQPLLGHVLSTIESMKTCKTAVIVGNQAELVSAYVEADFGDAELYTQREQLGTGDAVLAASKAIKQAQDAGMSHAMVLYGDCPLIKAESLKAAIRTIEGDVALAVLGFETSTPTGYGRLLVENGELVAIREEKDASDEERKVTLCNSGIMVFALENMLEILRAIDCQNAQGEYYLTDAVEIARQKGKQVIALTVDESETFGVNDRAQLAHLENLWQERKRHEVMISGVTLIAPQSVWFSYDTEIGRDALIEPNVYFGTGVSIGAEATILAHCHIEGTDVAKFSTIGPFARLRPGTKIDEGGKVGNFCELKNAHIEKGAKINHLSYIGDAFVGTKANVGAGTITCNYDGMNKHHTNIGAGSFIGSNSALVAPINIGAGAYVGSGSTVTDDVPDNALAIARGRQINKDGRAEDIRARNLAQKQKRQAEK